MESTPYKMMIGAKIRAHRSSLGMSVEKLALMIGINRNYLRSIELGRANPTVDVIVKIADGLDIPVWELMTPDKDS